MNKINLIPIALSLIGFVSAHDADGNYQGFMNGMMAGGYGFSGMWLFGWLFMGLIFAVLVLLIVWLIKQIQKK